jgi:hypothetical protein
MEKYITLRVGDVLPNPFRSSIGGGILHQEKLDSIKASFETNGVWDCWPVRKNKDGKYEMVGSTHRQKCARDVYGSKHELRFQLVDYDDAQMLRAMIDENLAGDESKNLSVREQADYVTTAEKFLKGHHDSCHYSKKDHDPGDLDCLLAFLGKSWTGKMVKTLQELHEKLAEELGESVTLRPSTVARLIEFPIDAQRAIIAANGGEEDIGKRDLKVLLDATKAERAAVTAASGKKREQEEAKLIKKLAHLTKGGVKAKDRDRAVVDGGGKPLPKVMTRDETILAFVSYLSFDAMKQAWKFQSGLYHPDKGGKSADASSFNELWERMKKLYGKDS